jgi:hypothetical protein
VRADAGWCTLCFAVLKDASDEVHDAPVEELTTPVQDISARFDPLGAPLDQVVALEPEGRHVAPTHVPAPVDAEPTWPCTVCGVANALSLTACADCGSAFLAAAADSRGVTLPLVGDLNALSRTQRLVGAVVLVLAFILPLALVTFLASGDPQPVPPAGPGVPAVQSP